MQAEFEPESIWIPDRIPDDMAARYGGRARRNVRYSRSRRYAITGELRRRLRRLRDADVSSLALLIFFGSVVAVAVIAALAYSVFLWPAVGLTVLTVVVLLFVASILVAVSVHRPDRPEGNEAAYF